MLPDHRKGRRRILLDWTRREDGEPVRNRERNRTPHCHFKAAAKAHRKKGRDRFKTGRKRVRRAN